MAEPDRDSQFLRWSLDLVDTGITAALPTYTLDVFKVIWRFTMRGEARDTENVKDHVLYSDVSQNLIAALVGCGRQWVNVCVGVLEEMHWLKRMGTPKPGGQQRYALGTLTPVAKKPTIETYWALTRSKTLMESVWKLEAKERARTQHKTYWEDRPEKVRDLLVGQGVVLPKLRRPAQRKDQKEARKEAEKEAPEAPSEEGVPGRLRRQGGRLRRQGWSPEATGGGRLRRQGVVASDDTLNREPLNREPSNREPSNISASADASPPACASGSGDLGPTESSPKDSAGNSANDNVTDPDQSSARNSDSVEQRLRYRVWLNRDDDAAEVVDENGELVVGGADENDRNDAGEDVDVNTTEKRQAAMAAAMKDRVGLHKSTAAVQEAKRNKLAVDKQRERSLAGPNLERYIPKGSVKRMERVWLAAFDEHYPDFFPAKWWTQAGENKENGRPIMRPGKESNLVKQLIQMYSVEEVEKYLKWAVANWGTVQTRFKNVPAVPAINFLYGFREALLPEAVLGSERAKIEAELDAWFAANPNSSQSPPEELLERLKAAKARG